MCQNSGSGMQSAQIQKFVEHGMPQKIVKTVQQTMRKRAAEQSVLPVAFVDSDDEALSVAEVDIAAPSCDSACNQRDSAPQLIQKAETLRQCPFKNSAPLEVRQRQLPDVDAKEKIATIGAEVVVPSKTTTRTFSASYSKKSDNDNEKVYVDALAIATQMTKQCFDRLAITAKNMQSSKLYTLLTRTTQPAHAVAIGVLALVLLTVWPNIFETRDPTAEAQKASANGVSTGHKLAVLAYLGAFATHFGAQIWMTFVSGLSLYFSLPRHIFGQCQQILFPKYFAMNATLSIGMLILFIKYFLGNWNLAMWVQLVTLALTAFIELTVRLYLAPPMLRLMLEKYKIEDAVGSGDEVGSLVQGDLVQCPHYQRIHKAFRRIHMTVAMGNMTVLLATCLHLYFLASKIQLAS